MLKIKQKAVVVTNDNKKNGVEVLNTYLELGYLLKDKQFMPEDDDLYASVIYILEKDETL